MTDKTEVSLIFKQYPILLPDAFKAFSICNKNAINAPELFALINADPILTAISYGMYHEFFPNFSQKFFGIPRIIVTLGINTVKSFIGDIARRGLSSPELSLRMSEQNDFLYRSLSTAIVSHLIAKERGISESELQEYYCAGLLYNIGECIVADYSGSKFNVPRETVAKEEAGRLAAALWGFPFSAAAAASHNVEKCDAALNAELAAHILTVTGGGQDVDGELFKRLDVPVNVFQRIKQPFVLELKRLELFMGLGGGGD
ncbi:MAG: HDOD domain-containing protein [Spirochaetaceae bacterium]|jgi:HD-like signal output (HDOD) protein|nr:HDOD domain-containing protein [Spirochaetaceae bacterium]